MSGRVGGGEAVERGQATRTARDHASVGSRMSPLRFEVSFVGRGASLHYDCSLGRRPRDVTERYVLERTGEREPATERTLETIDEMIADIRELVLRTCNQPACHAGD